MKQAAEEFIKSLRGKVSAEGEKVLDLIAILVDNEEDKRKRRAEKQEVEIDTPFSDYKVVEAFGTKMVAPGYAKYAAVDSDGLVYLYQEEPSLIEEDGGGFVFFGAGTLYIGKIKNREVVKNKEPCDLCVELKELDE